MAKKSKADSGGNREIRGVDLVEVERLLAFMEKHALEEFEYEREGVRIRLKKAPAQGAGAIRLVSAADISRAEEAHAAPVKPGGAARGAAAGSPSSELHLIKSPIVGTYYAAPSPGADPFVNRGSRVEPGQVLCIIEAMKLMNEIESDVAGEIVETFVENGSPVEYGQPLFGIRPQAKK
ncbi:MAG TPA: acetyl-CoA carboxylase biotin carboxyl carrier protein [Candidatus Acidoferrales bacterium]|nr:acetyl-CoA carboxylase biotin carboxyl carrier protein [Candidatus Acidoferrales bacterium]